MKTIVIDLELSQPSKRIIELGAVCIDLKNDTKMRNIKMFSKVANIGEERLSDFIIQLTGITQQEVDAGQSLETVLLDFWQWRQEEAQCKHISAWGNDYWHVLEACRDLKVHYPDKLKFLNIKEFATVFRSCLPQSRQKGGLKSTMEMFGLPFLGTPHRALVDSQNTARLLIELKENMRKFLQIKEVIL